MSPLTLTVYIVYDLVTVSNMLINPQNLHTTPLLSFTSTGGIETPEKFLIHEYFNFSFTSFLLFFFQVIYYLHQHELKCGPTSIHRRSYCALS